MNHYTEQINTEGLQQIQELMQKLKLYDYIYKSMKYTIQYNALQLNHTLIKMIEIFPKDLDIIQGIIAKDFSCHLKRFQQLMLLQ